MNQANERPWAVRATMWLLGGWVFVTVWMGFVAATNFRVTRELRDAEAITTEFGEGIEREKALKYVASELNRTLFASSERLQVALGLLAVACLVASRRGGRVRLGLLGACLLVTLGFHLALTPSMIEAGRRIDFIERDPDHPTDDERAFRTYHGVYMSVELAKLVVLLGLAGSLLGRPRQRDRDPGSPG